MKFEIEQQFNVRPDVLVEAIYDERLAEYYKNNMNTMIDISVVNLEKTNNIIKRQSKYLPEPMIKKVGTVKVEPKWMAWIEHSEFNKKTLTMKFDNIPVVNRIASLMKNSGSMTFIENSNGTKRIVKGELKIKVFLLGKIAEKIIYSNAKKILDEEAVVLKSFIAKYYN